MMRHESQLHAVALAPGQREETAICVGKSSMTILVFNTCVFSMFVAGRCGSYLSQLYEPGLTFCVPDMLETDTCVKPTLRKLKLMLHRISNRNWISDNYLIKVALLQYLDAFYCATCISITN